MVPVRVHQNFDVFLSKTLVTEPISEHPDTTVPVVKVSRTLLTGSPTTGAGGSVGIEVVGFGLGCGVGSAVGAVVTGSNVG